MENEVVIAYLTGAPPVADGEPSAARCPAAPKTPTDCHPCPGRGFALPAKSATLDINVDHHCLCDALCSRHTGMSMVIAIVFFN
ncbi:hypothetical protein [Burkholderia sp. BCC1644]|uniref:hypothetical protein n=1 Tax=Burkholderia sp. BCC1644 TaxID=2676293 RepID=UPI001590CADD|nr:hypothetical protein [Burkholderia sp. BCC1644]